MRELFLNGTDERLPITYRNRYGRKRSYATRFEGIVKGLERRYRESESEGTKEKIEQFMSLRACPVCGGCAVARGVARGARGGDADRRVLRAVRAAGAGVAGGGRAVGDRPARRAADPAGDLRAAAVPGERRDRLPVDGSRRRDAVRAGGAADPPRDADRVLAGGRAVHPRRALDRAASARQLEADRDPRALARPRQHGDRGRARRADDARRRPSRRHGPGRRRAWRGDRRAGHREAGGTGEGARDGPVPGGDAHDRGARQAAHPARLRGDRRREPAQPARRRREGPARRADMRYRGFGLGQVDACQRSAVQERRQPPAPRTPPAGGAPCDPRSRSARQDHRRRPVTDRAHPALEPGDVHGPVRRDPRHVLQDPGGARARLQARALLAST